MYHIHLLTHRGQSKSSDDVVSPSTPPDTWRNLIDGSPLSSWNDPNKTRLINRNACLLKGLKGAVLLKGAKILYIRNIRSIKFYSIYSFVPISCVHVSWETE